MKRKPSKVKDVFYETLSIIEDLRYFQNFIKNIEENYINSIRPFRSKINKIKFRDFQELNLDQDPEIKLTLKKTHRTLLNFSKEYIKYDKKDIDKIQREIEKRLLRIIK